MSNVVAITPNDQRSRITASLRKLADEIQSGECDPVTLVVIVDSRSESDLSVRTMGYRPRLSETIGLLEFAKICVYEEGQSDG